jgi:hypothetical protein
VKIYLIQFPSRQQAARGSCIATPAERSRGQYFCDDSNYAPLRMNCHGTSRHGSVAGCITSLQAPLWLGRACRKGLTGRFHSNAGLWCWPITSLIAHPHHDLAAQAYDGRGSATRIQGTLLRITSVGSLLRQQPSLVAQFLPAIPKAPPESASSRLPSSTTKTDWVMIARSRMRMAQSGVAARS